jgi:acyl dehydratase
VVERFLEDIEIGELQEAGPITVTAEEIVSFAERYDPLPMHISDAGGQATVHDSLIGSGVLTIALKQRLIMSIERNSAIIGAARIDDLNFLRPVRAGDELSMRQRCVDKRDSKSRPDRGLVTWEFEIFNQTGENVLTSRDTIMVRRRPVD